MNTNRRKKRISDFLPFILIILGLLPIAFVMTLLLHPFWRWMESNFHIEAFGHSGPAVWCYLLIYIVALSVAALLHRFAKAVAAVLVLVSVSIVLFPWPHGGSLGEALLHELTKSFREFSSSGYVKRSNDDTYGTYIKQPTAKLEVQRFAGTLPFEEDFVQGSWHHGSVPGSSAWLDGNTGMVWGKRQKIQLPGWNQSDLRTAMAWCATVEPSGYWSLPTNAEFALGVRDNMQSVIDDMDGRWIAQSHVFEGADPFPSLIGFGGGNDNNATQQLRPVSVRCIGRSDSAPSLGYFRKDISNEDAMRLLTR